MLFSSFHTDKAYSVLAQEFFSFRLILNIRLVTAWRKGKYFLSSDERTAAHCFARHPTHDAVFSTGHFQRRERHEKILAPTHGPPGHVFR